MDKFNYAYEMREKANERILTLTEILAEFERTGKSKHYISLTRKSLFLNKELSDRANNLLVRSFKHAIK